MQLFIDNMTDFLRLAGCVMTIHLIFSSLGIQMPSEYPLRPSKVVLTKSSGSGSRTTVSDSMSPEDLRTVATEVGVSFLS